MQQRSQRRNNVTAGLFVLIAVVAGAASIIVLSGANFGAKRAVQVAFSIEEGAAGLKPGSVVTLGGLEVGSVRSVGIDEDPSTGAPRRLLARLQVRRDVTLFDNARVFLIAPLLGGTSSLNITSVGTGPSELSSSDVIEASKAPPGFLASAGYGPEEVGKVRSIIDNVQAVTLQLKELSTESAPDLEAEIEAIARILTDVEAMISDTRATYGGWKDGVSTSIQNVEDATARLDPVMTSIESSTSDGATLMSDAKQTLADNREGIDNIIDSVESATEKVDTQTIESINETLTMVDSDLEQIRAWMRQSWPGVRKIIANLRLASDQVKLTMVEVRRSPWRLLYQPVKKELENELLYASARSYAESVSDLRSASESLEALQMIAGEDPSAKVDPEQIKQISTELSEAFARYTQAEEDFLTRLINGQSEEK